MEKTYKRIPFDIELAKKIQAGEIEGRIVTDTEIPVKILCFDRKVPEYIIVGLVNGYSVFCYSKDGVSEPQPERITHTIYIELPEEAPNLESISKYAEELAQKKEVALERWYKSQEAPKRVFHPFDRVLVRQNGFDKWKANFFSHMDDGYYKCVNSRYKECVLFKGNEHLVGTTDKPKED